MPVMSEWFKKGQVVSIYGFSSRFSHSYPVIHSPGFLTGAMEVEFDPVYH